MPKRIDLKGEFIQKEGEASATITPGDLVAFGGANDLQRPAGPVGDYVRKAFALENDLIGKGINDDYVAGDTVRYGVFPPGAEVYAWLALGQNVAKGAALGSAGANGALAASGSPGTNDECIAFALEAVNASGAKSRIKIEVA